LSETVRRCDEGIFAVNSSAICQKIAEVSIKKNQFLAKRNKFKQVPYFLPNKMGHSATFNPEYPLRSAATIRPFWPKCHQKHLILERATNRRNKKFKQVHCKPIEHKKAPESGAFFYFTFSITALNASG
jgi:hypothetical protein